LKAIIHREYGGPEVLKLEQVVKPSPAADEVLIKVQAVSINDWDWGLFQGNTFVNRLMYGMRKPKKQILGSDVAGIITEVGKDVTKFKTGDEVFGDLSGKWGGFAEYVCAKESFLALKPATMSFSQAAAIPQAAMLAVQGLIDKGKIRPGQKLLINGAGGGVGTFALQIAKTYNVEVTAVDSAMKSDMLRKLGADHFVDYSKEDFTKNKQQYDLILDVKTDRSILKYLRVLKPGGTYITVGGSMGLLFQALFLMPLLAMFSKKKVSIVVLKPNKDLHLMNELFEKGKVIPVIDGPYPLEELPDAFRHFGKGAHKGKIIITV
jgi:NADPH:quinone reductase-like Zn-dependent oxidoreductase